MFSADGSQLHALSRQTGAITWNGDLGADVAAGNVVQAYASGGCGSTTCAPLTTVASTLTAFVP